MLCFVVVIDESMIGWVILTHFCNGQIY